MLTDHDLQTELAAAFREQADPVTQAAVDSAGVFRRAVRSRRRRVAVRAASVLAVVAVAVGASVVSRIPRPEPSPAGQPPGLLLDAAVGCPAACPGRGLGHAAVLRHCRSWPPGWRGP